MKNLKLCLGFIIALGFQAQSIAVDEALCEPGRQHHKTTLGNMQNAQIALAEAVDRALKKYNYEFNSDRPSFPEIVRYNMDGIKDLYLDTSEPPESCLALLNQMDFSQPNIPEIDQERLEGAVLYIALGDHQQACQLLDYNIHATQIVLFQRVFSLSFICFSGIADSLKLEPTWIKERLDLLKRDCPPDDHQSRLTLAMLYFHIGDLNPVKQVWKPEEPSATITELWNHHQSKINSLDLWHTTSTDWDRFNNPFTSQNVEGVLALWELYFQAHTKRNVNKMARNFYFCV